MAQHMTKTSQGLVLRAGGARKSRADRILRCNYCKMEAPISQGGHMIRNQKGEVVCPMLLEKERNLKERKERQQQQQQQQQGPTTEAVGVRYSRKFEDCTEEKETMRTLPRQKVAPLKTTSRYAALAEDDDDDDDVDTGAGTGLVLKVATAPKISGAWSRVSKSQVRNPSPVVVAAAAATATKAKKPSKKVQFKMDEKVEVVIEDDFEVEVVVEKNDYEVEVVVEKNEPEEKKVDWNDFLADVADSWEEEMDNDGEREREGGDEVEEVEEVLDGW